MNDRDDFAELVGSARNVLKCSSLYFNGRIRYGTKGEKVEERLLCMDAVRVYICSMKIPVKIESQFNILSIKFIERVSDSHVSIETDEKQTHALYALQEKSSLEPFLIVLIRNLHAVFPHRLQAIVEIRPENEYDKLLRLSHEHYQESNEYRPCGGYSLHYECACDFHQIPIHRSVQVIVDTVFAHRISREFTFREFESIVQKDWLPIIAALRYNQWFRKIKIENTKLTSENIDELQTVIRLNSAIRDLRLINCGLKHDFCTRVNHSLSVSYIENLDLSNNALEDKGLTILSSSLQQRKLPLISISLQSCSLTHKSLYAFHTALITNNHLLKNLQVLNLAGNRIKEENCITILFQNSENVLEELHLSDVEFSLESFFHSLTTVTCKLRRLFISSIRTSVPASNSAGVKLFFSMNQTLEIVQLSNANLSNEFLRELCDGLHANVHLNELDLRLSGNQLEAFIHEYAARFASIPCLAALDVTGCDIDNNIPNFLAELKKNRKLKSLHIGKNFNNIKQKNIEKTIYAMKELVLYSNLEYLSIYDSKLKEHTADFLKALMSNASLKTLDIRGNLMGESGARVITHIVQINRNLHTIFLDRNLLTFNNFEEIVNAMDENYSIQYLPVPITDIIQMKITERERLERMQFLLNKLESICAKNQQQREISKSTDSLVVSTTANLTREMNFSWENQQQLIGDQASLDYILSCSNRANAKNDHTDLNSILTRTANIRKVSSQLYESYIEEEERLKNEWKEVCRVFQEQIIERNERLARKFYQLYQEQGTINSDDKFQEQIRGFFANSNENIDQLLDKEVPNRLVAYSRQCYVNVATCLQKRAYDATNDMALDVHKQLETTMFQTRIPQQGSLVVETQYSTPPATFDRSARNTNLTNRGTLKRSPAQPEASEDVSNSPPAKQTETQEYAPEPSPKPLRTSIRSTLDKDTRALPTTPSKGPIPTSPKPSIVDMHKSIPNNPIKRESSLNMNDPIYSNVQIRQRMKKKETSMDDDEGDSIEHDLLTLVQEEQQRDLPPKLPPKERAVINSAMIILRDNNPNLDVNIEPTTKLVHPGKDRPRRSNVRRPLKRSGTGLTNDSSSDGGLLTDDNDDNSQGSILPSTSNEITSSTHLQTSETPQSTMSKLMKSAMKPSRSTTDEPPATPVKPPAKIPVVYPRPSSLHTMTKSMTIANTESPTTGHSDSTKESPQSKPSMSTSLYSPSVLTNNNGEQKETSNTIESVMPSRPLVAERTGKKPIGKSVLPVPETNGDVPPVKLRHVQGEKRPSLGLRSSTIDPPLPTEIGSGDTSTSSSPSNTAESNEQYKPLSVKERARQIAATTIPPGTSTDKKSAISSSTPPYTPRTYRRIIEQVNLFC